jgi:hypothetical protein
MPISLETIETKLNDREFSNLSELESYFKRMIANAKDFYARHSDVYDDAERVRKALSNYMTKTNPAYQTRGYTAVPTPLPPEDADGEEDDEAVADEDDEVAEDDDNEDGQEDEDEDEEDGDGDGDEDDEDDSDVAPTPSSARRRGPGRPPKSSGQRSQRASRASISQSKPDAQYEDVPYKGLSFQQAQEKMVEEMIRKKEDEYVTETCMQCKNNVI